MIRPEEIMFIIAVTAILIAVAWGLGPVWLGIVAGAVCVGILIGEDGR